MINYELNPRVYEIDKSDLNKFNLRGKETIKMVSYEDYEKLTEVVSKFTNVTVNK